MSDGTYETVSTYELYAFDCPECSGQTSLGDVDPAAGELIECADCGSCFEVVGLMPETHESEPRDIAPPHTREWDRWHAAPYTA